MSSTASPANDLSEANAKARRAHLKEVTAEDLPPPATVAEAIRAARIKSGGEIETISKTLRIKPLYLEALETGRHELLPGRTYAIGFLRTYADYLGLNGREMAERFKAEFKGPEPVVIAQGDPPQSAAMDDVRLPQGALVMALALVILAIFAGIYLFQSASDTLEERARSEAAQSPAAQSPAQTAKQEGAAPSTASPVGSAGGSPDPSAQGATAASPATDPAATGPVPSSNAPSTGNAPVTAPTTTPGASSMPAVGTASVPAKPLPGGPALAPPPSAEPAAEASAAPAPTYEEVLAKAPRTLGAAARQARVALVAGSDVFVRIETEGSRSQVLFEGNLAAGDVYLVPAVNDVVLVTRNGGALEIFVDGERKGPAGPAGVALKGLSLGAEGLKARN